MNHISTPIFQALFQTDVPRIILQANSPDFTILDFNTAFRQAIGNSMLEHRGKSVWTAFSAAIKHPEVNSILTEIFQQAISNRKQVQTPTFRYDFIDDKNGAELKRWWQLEILPVSKDNDEINYLLITANNITQSVLAERHEQALVDQLAASNEELSAANEELSATLEDLQEAHQRLEQLNQDLELRIAQAIKEIAGSERNLRNLIMTAHYPLMILRGRDWIIEIANQPLVNLWDRSIEEVTGRRLMDILPELDDQIFPKLLRQVYETGVPYGQEEQLFYYKTEKGIVKKYVSFYYDPLPGENGTIDGIIVTANDITEQVRQRQLLEEALGKETELTDRMSALNEELAATVEELSATNEDLILSQLELKTKNEALRFSEERFRSLISQAPIGICVLRASDLVVIDVNDEYLMLIGKSKEEVNGQKIWEIVSEAADGYAPVLNEVIETGKTFRASEHEVELVRFGVPESVILDFVYEPVTDGDGKVTAIMVVAIDVTAQVRARRAIEDAEERTRLAVEAAEIGTFEFSYTSDNMVTSERFDQIFGVRRPKSRAELLRMFHPDDLHFSPEAHAAAKRDGRMMYEARLIHPDNSIRWIRVQAKLYRQADGSPEKLLGTVLDITDFKRLQQQKDDFISIASHELKTPITSLKASLQLLQRIKETPDDVMFPRLLDQADRSMEKISGLIDDLLNVSITNRDSIILSKTTFRLKDLLDDCCMHIRETGQFKIEFEGDPDLCVCADQHRIDQVVANFLNNAVKYAPFSDTIYLKVEKENNAAKVSVRDSGPGIPREQQGQIFDRYFRGNGAGNHVSGLGLGLYISADIIYRHQGEIGVISEPGEGATFWFTLPLQ